MSELRVERKENMAGGKGHVIIKQPGCSLGYHEHHNESETYYILRGEEIIMIMV